MLSLAQEGPDKATLGRDLAIRSGVPANYLSKILLELKKAGLVQAVRGTGGGYRLADAEYDCNALYDLAHANGHQLLAPKRQKHRGLGHRRQSPYRLRSIELMQHPFGKLLYRFRRQIERDFGNLVSFGGGLICLPAWVRRFPRVCNWVQAKLLINAARWFHNHPEVKALA